VCGSVAVVVVAVMDVSLIIFSSLAVSIFLRSFVPLFFSVEAAAFDFAAGNQKLETQKLEDMMKSASLEDAVTGAAMSAAAAAAAGTCKIETHDFFSLPSRFYVWIYFGCCCAAVL
jgi:hypothetical protein